MTVFARAGERVVTEDGEYICRVKNDLHIGGTPLPKDFDDWQYEQPKEGDPFGRGFRLEPAKRFPQVCIDGKWKP